jgi:hypothetical protein
MADDKMKTRIEFSLAEFMGQEVTPKLIDSIRSMMQRVVGDSIKTVVNRDTVEVLCDPQQCDRMIVRIGASRTPKLVKLDFERNSMTAQEQENMTPEHKARYKLEERLMELGYGEDIELCYPTGYADCVLGVAESGFMLKQAALVVSKTKVLEKLVKDDGMSEDEALEFFDFNISGAYVGEGTPVFVETI